jgi:hypothetical protein
MQKNPLSSQLCAKNLGTRMTMLDDRRLGSNEKLSSDTQNAMCQRPNSLIYEALGLTSRTAIIGCIAKWA